MISQILYYHDSPILFCPEASFIKTRSLSIKNKLLETNLINSTTSYLSLNKEENENNFSYDILSYEINSEDFTSSPTLVLDKIRNGWERSNKLYVLKSNDKNYKSFEKIVTNTIGQQSIPVAPGFLFFFKNENLRELYLYSIHDSQSHKEAEDLLVYLALTKLKNESILAKLPDELKEKVINKLGNNIRALGESRKLLLEISKPGFIKDMCNNFQLGIQDENALWIHTSLIKTLHPALRVYIGCSSFFYGEPESADIIKIHKNSSKITFYLYDDFENKLLPEMQDRIKIDLSKQKVDHFDHRSKKNPEVVFFKERFIEKENKYYEEWTQFSKHLLENGCNPKGIHTEKNKTLKDLLKSFCA